MRVAIIGAGAVADSVIAGIRNSGNKTNIEIFSGEQDATVKAHEVSDFWTKSKVSPKLRQPDLQDSVNRSRSFIRSNSSDSSIIYSFSGVGGAANFWGASIAEFSQETIEKNGMSYVRYSKNLKRILDKIPSSGKASNFFKLFNHIPLHKSVEVSDRIRKYYTIQKEFICTYPILAVDSNKCIGCKNCIDGCNYEAIWPTKADLFDFNNININKKFVLDISRNSEGHYELYDDCKNLLYIADVVILAANVISNFYLLAKLTKCSNANIYTTPSYAFAYTSIENKPLYCFGMANATFSILKSDHVISYGNLYDGSTLSISKKRIFHSNFFIDYALKIISNRLILGAGFLSSDNASGSLTLGDDSTVSYSITKKGQYHNSMKYIKNKIKVNLVKSALTPFHFSEGNLGADIHYSGGVPVALKNDPDTGEVFGYHGLYLAGGANFKYLPPESPTLSFLANAYGVGEAVVKRIENER